jgi:hypothetical protein
MLHLRPQLAISSLEPPDSFIKELAEVASLANSIAVWRSKGSKSTGGGHDAWKETIDALDRDGTHGRFRFNTFQACLRKSSGVELWNTAGILRFSPVTPAEKVSKTQAMSAFSRHTPSSHNLYFIGSMMTLTLIVSPVRLAAFRLIDAGLEVSPPIESTCD